LQIDYWNASDAAPQNREEKRNYLNPYALYKYSIRSELTRKYYDRRLRKFFDFIQFDTEIEEIENSCNGFAEKEKVIMDGH
jgi:hypothetical protein